MVRRLTLLLEGATMASDTKTTRSRPPEFDRPIYWFAVLEQALDRSDLATAARAQRELKRLGITVNYQRGEVKPCH